MNWLWLIIVIILIILIFLVSLGWFFSSESLKKKQDDGNCWSTSDCPNGQICNSNSVCSLPECLSDSDCKDGKVCGAGICLSATCNPVIPCPSGQGLVCNNQYSLCVPAVCTSNEACPQGMECVNGTCVAKNSGCQENSDCTGRGEACITGLCVPFGCTSDSQCGSGESCVLGSCISSNSNDVCTLPPDHNFAVFETGDDNVYHYLQLKNSTATTIYIGTWGQLLDPVRQTPVVTPSFPIIVQAPFGNAQWELKPGESMIVKVPKNWQGRFWGRTGCTTNNGTFSCVTGDCGSLDCQHTGAPNVTLAEFNFDAQPAGFPNPLDYYDVSLVDAFNLGITITPLPGSFNPNKGSGKYWCSSTGCTSDLLTNCPSSLQVRDNNNKTVACLSGCTATGSAQYCCAAYEGQPWGTPSQCIPSRFPQNYPAYFKERCPNLYSFAYDDTTSTWTCTSADTILSQYSLTFTDKC